MGGKIIPIKTFFEHSIEMREFGTLKNQETQTNFGCDYNYR